MKKDLNESLFTLLKTLPRFVDESGELVKTAVVNSAWNSDPELITLLLGDAGTRAKFFDEIEGHRVFNLKVFVDYVADKNFLANSYTQFRNRIGLNIGGKFLHERGEVSLVWPYKDCVLEGGQTREEEKREEIFFNEILAQGEIDRLFDPKVLTNWKRYTEHGELDVEEFKWGRDGALKENLIIKGNNLLVLHSLKAQYAGKVKLLYIDPPYNTGNDSFKYNDRFNHSTWLTFMRNRLEAAKALLAEDGVIVVQINDKEQAYLKVLMDEIFDQNYQGTIVVKMSHLSGPKMSHKEHKILKTIEYLHVFSFSSGPIKIQPQYVATSWEDAFGRYTSFICKCKKDPDDITKWEAIPLQEAITKARVKSSDKKAKEKFLMSHADCVFQTTINRSKKYPKEPIGRFLMVEDVLILNGREVELASKKIRTINGVETPTTIVGDIWLDIGINNVFQEGGEDIRMRFGKKPEMLLERIIKSFTDEGDIVLDFFAGTGTTAAVAHKLKRKWLAIEQLDYISTLTVPRLKNVIDGDQTGVSKSVNWQGGGDFIYCELMQYNGAWIDKIQAAQSSVELVDIWRDMARSSFLNWYANSECPEDAVDHFIAVGKEKDGLAQQKRLLAELLDKNQLYVNLTEIDDEDFAVSEEDKALNHEFFTGEHVDPDEGLELREEFVEIVEASIAEGQTGDKTTSIQEVAENLGVEL